MKNNTNNFFTTDFDEYSLENSLQKVAAWFDLTKTSLANDIEHLLELQKGFEEIILLNIEYEYCLSGEYEPTWVLLEKISDNTYENYDYEISNPLNSARNRHMSAEIIEFIQHIEKVVRKRKKLGQKLMEITSNVDNLHLSDYLSSIRNIC